MLPICAQIEAEIADMSAEDKEMFLSELGLKESGLNRIIKQGYSLLGLISYLTAGVQEVRAWTITNGTKYDLLCAVGLYKSAVQVYPIKFLPEGGSVETVSTAATVRALEGGIEVNAEGNVLVVNAAGQVVANQTVNGTATIALAKGFYIVRAADTVAKVIVK